MTKKDKKFLEKGLVSLQSQNGDDLVKVVIEIRNFITCESSEELATLRISEIMTSDILTQLLDLAVNENPSLQTEAFWTLTTISSNSSHNLSQLLNHNYLTLCLQHLTSSDATNKENALCSLGNIANENEKTRDYLLNCQLTTRIADILQHPDYTHIAALWLHGIWTLNCLTRGFPAPDFDHFKPVVGFVIMTACMTTDLSVKMEAVSTLCNLCLFGAEAAQFCFQLGALGVLAISLEGATVRGRRLVLDSLKTLCGYGSQRDTIVSHPGLMNKLDGLAFDGFEQGELYCVLDICVELSAASAELVGIFLAKTRLMGFVKMAGMSSEQLNLKACLFFANLTRNRTTKMAEYLTQLRVCEVFAKGLQDSNSFTALISIEAFLSLFKGESQ